MQWQGPSTTYTMRALVRNEDSCPLHWAALVEWIKDAYSLTLSISEIAPYMGDRLGIGAPAAAFEVKDLRNSNSGEENWNKKLASHVRKLDRGQVDELQKTCKYTWWTGMGSGTGKTVLILPLCFLFFSALNLEGSIWSSPKDHDRNNQNSQPYFNAQKRCDTNSSKWTARKRGWRWGMLLLCG